MKETVGKLLAITLFETSIVRKMILELQKWVSQSPWRVREVILVDGTFGLSGE